MSSISPTRFGPPSPTSPSGPEASGAAAVRRLAGGAEIRWVLPTAATFLCDAETTVNLHVPGRGSVPVQLKLADGPTLRVVYQDGHLPPDFDNFRAFVSAPGLSRTEMGGSTTRDGFFSFQTMPLADRWEQPAGPLLIEITGI